MRKLTPGEMRALLEQAADEETQAVLWGLAVENGHVMDRPAHRVAIHYDYEAVYEGHRGQLMGARYTGFAEIRLELRMENADLAQLFEDCQGPIHILPTKSPSPAGGGSSG